MNWDTVLYVKPPKRQTRRESQDATRERLIKAAEEVIVRAGFEAASVERITEAAGFSRGAFYSNFRTKDELFVAVLNKIRREIAGKLEEIFRREDNPARRLQQARQWYVRQKLSRKWVVLETEFTLRALRNRSARRGLAELQRQDMDNYSALVASHFSDSGLTMASPPEVVALSLLATAKGLSVLSLLDEGQGQENIAMQCRDLVFDKLIASGEGVRKIKRDRK
jgi:AcrR family transcriptional regulator